MTLFDNITQDRDGHSISLVLYQPEIAGNTGTLLRLAACWGMPLMIIEPTGFIMSDRRFRRSVMDYYDMDMLHKYSSWDDFYSRRDRNDRLVSVTPCSNSVRLDQFSFCPGDFLVLGSEQSGLPDSVMDQCHVSVRIPMRSHCRSMNLAVAGAVVWAEALRQVKGFP